MRMKQENTGTNAIILERLRRGALPLMFAATLWLPTAAQAQITPDSAAARCKQWFASVRNIQELAPNQQTLLDVKRCIDLGVDPPLKARTDYGRNPASGVPVAQIPGTTCPPFATCLYSARVNSQGAMALNYGAGGTGSSINDAPIGSTYSAPQFVGHLPEEIPEHLENGGTIYFYGSVDIVPPSTSLIYPDASLNYYADGAEETITNGHIMMPPAPNGDIMAQQPVVVKEAAKFNFDDGGVIVLPNGFSGMINGQQVKGGDVIVINHADDLMVPAGTKLYPKPAGTDPQGEHADDPNNPDYTGDPVKMPNNPAMTINDKKKPGATKWW